MPLPWVPDRVVGREDGEERGQRGKPGAHSDFGSPDLLRTSFCCFKPLLHGGDLLQQDQ